MGVRKILDASDRTFVAKGGEGGNNASSKSGVYVEALIDNGAKVKEDFKKKTKEWIMINLRISTEMLKEVDKAVNERVGITRTGWILEAIHEKLKTKD